MKSNLKNNNNNNNNDMNFSLENKEISFQEIFNILLRRKIIIFLSITSFFIIAIIYNIFRTPVYEATVLLKKEKATGTTTPNELKQILLLQSPDEIETEMEILKSRRVLKGVINELKLYLKLNKMVYANGKELEINKSFLEYNQLIKKDGVNLRERYLPEFLDIKLKLFSGESEFYLKKISDKLYGIYDVDSNTLLASTENDSLIIINIPLFTIIIKWPHNKVNDKFYFKLKDYQISLSQLKENIKVKKISKTEIFKVSVRNSSPFLAQTIANEIASKFRETRLEQKRETIKYSFDFIDNQLQSISNKLKEAEAKLSDYKKKNKLVTIDEASTDFLKLLSSLEAEKNKTDIELMESQKKYEQMFYELKSKGYFDQTFLTPEPTDASRSSFQILLQQLSNAELKKIQLLNKRKKSHPDVIAIDKQISQIKRKLSEYNENTLTAYQIIINTLKKKRADLQKLIKNYSKKMAELPQQEAKLAELIRQRDVYEKMFKLLLNKREEMRMAELSKFQDIVIVDSAELPYKSIIPKRKLNIIIGILLGIVVGIFLVFMIEYFDRKVVDIAEIENKFNLSILSIIPKYSKSLIKKIENNERYENKFITLYEGNEEFKESFRLLRTKILNLFEGSNKTILFTSCEEDTGKTTIVSNLGVILAKYGKKVLIIDCDLKKAGLSKFFNIPQETPGLIYYLTKKENTPIIYYIYKAFDNNEFELSLDIISSGGIIDNSSELLGSYNMKQLLEVVESMYDHILIDTPPVTQIVDTLVLGKYIKNVILAIRPNHTFKDSLLWGLQELNEAEMRILGVVVNACELQKSSYKYRYGYGYGYKYKKSV